MALLGDSAVLYHVRPPGRTLSHWGHVLEGDYGILAPSSLLPSKAVLIYHALYPCSSHDVLPDYRPKDMGPIHNELELPNL